MNIEKLKEIVNATLTGGHAYVGAEDGAPLRDAGYIVVNMGIVNPNGNGEVAAQATDAGKTYVASLAPQASQVNNGASAAGAKGSLITGFVAPAAKRRGNASGAGAPSKYPFDKLELGASFFVGNSEVEKGDAFKTMSATVSSTNRRNSEETGETIQVERAKCGEDKKPILNADGSKVMETVTQKKRKALKHYKIVAVEGGKEYGGWTAPENGAVIIRDL